MQGQGSKIAVCGAAMAFFAGLVFLATADDQLFPDAPAKPVFLRVCSQCHPVDPIASLRHTKPEWSDIVDNMAAMGADATEEELNMIVDYLSKYFGKSDEQNEQKK
jgi:hypothetical protein